MENPLKSLFAVDERSDGVYIKVPREKQFDVTDEQIVSMLQQAGVTNYYIDTICDVVSRARGAFEKIGPPFEYYNASVENYLALSVPSPDQAVLSVNSLCLADHVTITTADLKEFLKRKGVVEGVKEDALRRIADEKICDQEEVVAESTPPKDGDDAQIIYEIDIKKSQRPDLRSDGSVDFRNIKTFVEIKQGAILARKVPPTPGTPGKTVSGKEIPSTPGADRKLPAGKNTTVSEDGLQLRAAKTGIVYREGDIIHVGEMLQVPKNVDYSVGNIKYSGDVVINGNVMPGFTVESEGNIFIGGEVESATVISRNGSVSIQKGILGKEETKIYGKNGISVSFAQDAQLTSEGIITIGKYCLHCTCVCDALRVNQKDSSIIGGTIAVYNYIDAFQIGNEKNVHTRISVVDKESLKIKEKIKELDSLEEKLGRELDPVKRELKSKAAILKKAGSAVTERSKQEMQKQIEVYNTLNKKIKYIHQKRGEFNQVLENPTYREGFVKVWDTMYAGVDVTFYGMTKKIKNNVTNKIFRFRDGEINEDIAQKTEE